MSDSEVKKIRALFRAVIIALVGNAAVIAGAIWFMSALNQRVAVLEDGCAKTKEDVVELRKNKVGIDDMTLKYNNYYTTYMWAVMWGHELPEPPYNIRGVVPNM